MTGRRPVNRGPFPSGEPRARFVIHVPVAAVDVGAARAVAYLLARWWSMVPGVGSAGVTVSGPDAELPGERVFCDRCRGCALRTGHGGRCTTRPG